MSFEVYSLYLITLAAFFMGPPDSTELLTISNSMRHGMKKAWVTVVGDLSANVVQMTVAAFGLASLIAASAGALIAIKWAGVAYLVFLGLKMMFSKSETSEGRATQVATPRALFSQGFVTALANPWAVIFFAALFPQFIDANAPILPQLLILGVTYVIIDGAQLLAYGYGAEAAKKHLTWLQGPVLSRISGGLMLGAALLLASKDFSDVKGNG